MKNIEIPKGLNGSARKQIERKLERLEHLDGVGHQMEVNDRVSAQIKKIHSGINIERENILAEIQSIIAGYKEGQEK